MNIVYLFNYVWKPVSNFLLNYYNWYIILLIYSFLFYLLNLYVMYTIKSELRKRREIMQDINLYKGTHPDELYPNATEEQMKSVFHRNHPQYTENYYLALEQIIKQRKGRPLIALLLIFVQYLLYTSMFGHLYTIGPYYVSHGQLLYYLSIIILVLRLWNKKRVWIKVCFVLLLSISYRFLPSATLLFICYTSFFSLAMTWYGKIRRRSHK